MNPDALFETAPANRLLGMELIASSEAGADVRMPVREDVLQERGIVHGGILTAIADTAAVYAVFPYLPDGKTMTSIEFKVNFLAPALPEEGDLLARSSVVKRGKRIAVVDVAVFQGESMVAKGMFTYLIFEVGGSS